MASKPTRHKGAAANNTLPDLALPSANGIAGQAAKQAAAASTLLDDTLLEETPLNFAQKIAQVLEDDEAVEGTEFEDLQQVLQKVIKTKSDRAQQKQRGLLQELQSKLDAQVKALESAVAKDAKDGKAICTSSFDGLLRRLEDKCGQLDNLNKKYQQDLHRLWEEYNDIYNCLDGTKTEVTAIATKKRAALKRKITQVQGQCQEQLQDAEKKIAKLKNQSAKLPGLTNVLKAFM